MHNSLWQTVPLSLLSHPLVAHSMVNIGKPDVDPSSEQDIMSETSTLPGAKDAVRVQVVLILTVTRHR
jgi:hypothetical protein